MTTLEFTSDDLQANRAGQLSAVQIDRLGRARRRNATVGVGVVIVVAFIATLLLFAGQRNTSPILGALGIAVTTINAVLVGMFARNWLRFNADLREGQVTVIKGTLERVIRPTGRVNNYVIRVDGESFSVTKEQFKAFDHEQPYCLYRAPHAGMLLSAELDESISEVTGQV